MSGSKAANLRVQQNIQIGAVGALVMVVGCLIAMMSSFEPTSGTVYGSYMMVTLGVIGIAAAVSRSTLSPWIKGMVWSALAMLVGLPVSTFLLT